MPFREGGLTRRVTQHPTLAPNEVHIWYADLNLPEPNWKHLEQTLSEDEQIRAGKYAFPHLRRRFVVARGILRTLLGAYLETPPQALQLSYGAFGKPVLEGDSHTSTCHFNLSHTEEVALFAFSFDTEVGIDVELMEEGVDILHLARQYFSTREYSDLLALPIPQRLAGFYTCWTRKEAYLKALGTGLSTDLASFDVEVSPLKSAQLLQVEDARCEAQKWRLYDIPSQRGYCTSLATREGDWNLKCFSW